MWSAAGWYWIRACPLQFLGQLPPLIPDLLTAILETSSRFECPVGAGCIRKFRAVPKSKLGAAFLLLHGASP